ncbi:MAG: SBBP repeat-containing protein [Terriglobales bacterium]
MSRRKLPFPGLRTQGFLSLAALVAVALAATAAWAQQPRAAARLGEQYAHLPLTFQANQGQTSAQAQFLARSQGAVVFLTVHGVVVKSRAGALSINFAGAAAAPQAQGEQPLATRVHYMAARENLAVRSFAQVRYTNMYPGVDVTYYGRLGQMEYDLRLAPYANLQQVRLRFRGVTPRLGAAGALELQKGVSLQAPVAYQWIAGRRRTVSARYVLHPDASVTLALGRYDSSQALVVDPILTFATLLGGTGYNQANAVAVDRYDDGYIAGYTLSSDFPPVNAFQATLAPGQYGPDNDAFVAEISPDGNKLIYSTYLGGNGDDRATGIAIDSTGAAYVTGYTSSTNFPLQAALQGSNAGGYDAFVAKLAPLGATLAYSTYLGGSQDDRAAGIAVDGAGEAFVVGTTASSDFPVSATAPQKTFGGSTDAFAVALNSSGSATLYATYIGGSGTDSGSSVAVDATGNAYVGGATASSDLPVTPGALQSALAGKTDGFVAQILHSGSSFGWVTYLGGSKADEVNAVAVDTAGSVYAAGDTSSIDLFPGASSVYQQSLAGGTDAFVAKINNQGSNLIYGTYLGGGSTDVATAVAVDSSNNVYVAGNTSSSDFPVTSNATQSIYGGAQDGFLSKLDPQGQNLLYSSYLGGSGVDAVTGMAIQSNGDLELAGYTFSNNFPTTPGVFQTAANSATDAFVARFEVAAQGVFSPNEMGFAAQAPTVASAAQAVTFTNGGELPLTISSIATTGPYTETDNCSQNNSTLQPGQSCTLNVVFTPTAVGAGNGTLVISDNSPSGSETLQLSGSGGDFAITVAPTSLTISAGASGSFAVNLAPATGFEGVVTLSCTGIGSAQNATCTPSPASLTMNGTSTSTATMTVTTTVRPSLVPWLPQAPAGPWFWLALAGLFMALVGTAYALRTRGVRRRLGWIGTAVLLGLSLAAAGCGGSTVSQGTIAGNYNLVFTGTSGSATHSQTVVLTVN